MVNSDDFAVKDIIEKDIFTLLGAQNLSEDEKDELMKKMLETIRFRVIDRVSEMISKDDMNVWIDLMEPSKEAELNKFLVDKKIDLAELMMEEAVNYKIQLKTYANYMKTNKDILSTKNQPDNQQSTNNDVNRTFGNTTE